MLSIIVCSRNSSLSKSFSNNIKITVGVEYELICIDNSKNAYSISQAYNEGKLISKFNYLCFVHEDVTFHTQNWGEKVITHLNVPNTGIIGLAGGDAAFNVLYDYGTLNRSMNIIHVDKKGIEPIEVELMPKNYSMPTRSVVLLDGVILCAKRELFNGISFDESFGGFHGYDYDISIQSIVAGYYNYVMYNVSLTHYSKGLFDAVFYKSIIKVFDKWKNCLPLFEHSISIDEQKRLSAIYEKRSINKLLKKLIRTKTESKDIVEIYSFYMKVIGSKKDIYLLNIIKMRILLIYMLSVFRKKIITK